MWIKNKKQLTNKTWDNFTLSLCISIDENTRMYCINFLIINKRTNSEKCTLCCYWKRSREIIYFQNGAFITWDEHQRTTASRQSFRRHVYIQKLHQNIRILLLRLLLFQNKNKHNLHSFQCHFVLGPNDMENRCSYWHIVESHLPVEFCNWPQQTEYQKLRKCRPDKKHTFIMKHIFVKNVFGFLLYFGHVQ